MDSLNWIELANLAALALLFGGEVGLILGTHPALARLKSEHRVIAMRPVCKRHGLVLPILALFTFATATVATIGLAFVHRPFWLGAIAWICLGLVVLILFRFLRPVNAQLAAFPENGQGWGGLERSWQLWHAAVAVLAGIAFALFAVAALMN